MFTAAPDIRAYKLIRNEMSNAYQGVSMLRDRSETELDEGLTTKVDLPSKQFVGIADESPESSFTSKIT